MCSVTYFLYTQLAEVKSVRNVCYSEENGEVRVYAIVQVVLCQLALPPRVWGQPIFIDLYQNYWKRLKTTPFKLRLRHLRLWLGIAFAEAEADV